MMLNAVGFKMAPRRPQIGQDGSKMALPSLKMAPHWPQNGRKTAARLPKTAHKAQDDPKTTPRQPKMGSR